MAIKACQYIARAVGQVVLGKSKQHGTPFIEFYFQVKGGESDGARVRWTSYFTDKTYERTVQALESCGWSGDDISVFADSGLHGLDKNDVEIVVENENYTDKNGEVKTSSRVAWINRLGYLNTEAAMSEDAAAAFGAKMNDLIAAMRMKSPRKAPVEETKSDDIPF
jgi:hypothetical protein